MRLVAKGATSQIEMFEVLDSASTTGGRKTGLVFNTASLTAYYTRAGAAATAITLITQTVTGAYSSGGFVEVSSTNAPGIYRLDVPDAAYASGVDSVVVTLKGASGMVQVSKEIMLIGVNLQDTVRAGLTALPNAAAEAAGGLYTRGSGAGQINQNNNGNIDTNTVRINAVATTSVTTVNANVGLTQPLNFTGTGASALAKSDMVDVAGAAVSTSTAQIGVNAVNIGGTAQTGRDIGASVLLSSGTGTGQLDFTSGVVKANLAQILGTALTETAGLLAGGFKKFFNVSSPTGTLNSIPDAVAGATGGLFIAGSNAATTANITGNLTGNVSGSVGSVTGAVGSVTGNVGGNVTGSVGSVASGGITTASFAAGAIDAAAIATDAIGSAELATSAATEIAGQVWDVVLSGHLTAGTTGAGLNAAGSAGDPWATAVPGAYGAGSAGKILGDNLNATVSSRATPAQILTTPANLLATDSSGRVTVGTNADKTGYTVSTVSDKTGYSLANGSIAAATFAAGAVDATAFAQGAADKVWATTTRAITDKVGFSLSSAGVQAIWDALTSALTTVGSVGKRIADNLDATVSSRLASASYTAPDNADVVTILGLVDTEVAAIKAKTDNLPAAPAAVGDIPTANQNADALLDRSAGVETNRTPRQALRLMLAAMAGKLSGAATTTVSIRDSNDSKDRIVATVDSSGNRTAVTLDGS